MKQIIIVLLAICFFVLVWFVVMEVVQQTDTPTATYLNFESLDAAYPSLSNNDTIVRHTAYHLSYNEHYEQANWVAYLLTRAMVEASVVERADNFREDPDILSGSAQPKDYVKSGYDRGHLAPAADMAWSGEAMSESFFMSNMSPQLPGFNRGIWKVLEAKVRQWAIENDSILVVTGPALTDIDEYIGENQVAVPKFYFKAILDISAKDGYKAVGFWLPNTKADATSLRPLSIDALEKISGLNFFGTIEPAIMTEVEQALPADSWQ